MLTAERFALYVGYVPFVTSRVSAMRHQGIEGFGFYDDCVVPIIENTARESHLTMRLQAAITAYPKSKAVLVRRHGMSTAKGFFFCFCLNHGLCRSVVPYFCILAHFGGMISSGVYVWGKDWKQAKGQAECYDYLFEAKVRMKQLGMSIPRFGAQHGKNACHMLS